MKTTALAALMMCCLPAVPGPAQDSPKPKTAPEETKAAVPKDVLKTLTGSWEGTCQAWFQPGKPADESKVKGEIAPLLDGRLIRHTYESTMMGKPRHGEETLTWNTLTKRYQVSWVDDFHMRNGILFSEGEPGEKGFTVKGKWQTGPNAPAWGWNTVFEIVDADHLTITAWLVTPEGQEKKAVETKYTRVKK